MPRRSPRQAESRRIYCHLGNDMGHTSPGFCLTHQNSYPPKRRHPYPARSHRSQGKVKAGSSANTTNASADAACPTRGHGRAARFSYEGGSSMLPWKMGAKDHHLWCPGGENKGPRPVYGLKNHSLPYWRPNLVLQYPPTRILIIWALIITYARCSQQRWKLSRRVLNALSWGSPPVQACEGRRKQRPIKRCFKQVMTRQGGKQFTKLQETKP